MKTLGDLGAKVETIDPPFGDPADCFRILWWSGARALLGRLPKEKMMLVDPALADVVRQSMAISLDDYLDAVKARGALGSTMRVFMEKYDLLVTPSLPIAAFEAGKLSTVDDNTANGSTDALQLSFNLTQQPAASVPCGFTKAGFRRPPHRRPHVRR